MQGVKRVEITQVSVTGAGHSTLAGLLVIFFVGIYSKEELFAKYLHIHANVQAAPLKMNIEREIHSWLLLLHNSYRL